MPILPRIPRAVVFDMDGLLIESEVLYRDGFLLAAREGGHDMRAEHYQQLCGGSWEAISATILAEWGHDFPIERFGAAWTRHVERLMAEGVALKPGVTDMLDLLDALALPRAIATASPHASVRRHLDPFDLVRRFDHVVARGDYAEPKPSPLPYLAAAKRLGVDPAECLALEDSRHGVHSAATAGMMTIMIPDIVAPTEAIRAMCHTVASDLHAVADLLRQTVAGHGPSITLSA